MTNSHVGLRSKAQARAFTGKEHFLQRLGLTIAPSKNLHTASAGRGSQADYGVVDAMERLYCFCKLRQPEGAQNLTPYAGLSSPH